MNFKIIFIASFGAAVLELLYWYELRKRLESSRYRRLLRSRAYWVVVVLFVLASGFATWVWYGAEPAGQMSQDPRDYFLAGAALPLLVKSAVRALGSKGSPDLGSDGAPEVKPAGAPGKDGPRKGVWKSGRGDYFQTGPIR